MAAKPQGSWADKIKNKKDDALDQKLNSIPSTTKPVFGSTKDSIQSNIQVVKKSDQKELKDTIDPPVVKKSAWTKLPVNSTLFDSHIIDPVQSDSSNTVNPVFGQTEKKEIPVHFGQGKANSNNISRTASAPPMTTEALPVKNLKSVQVPGTAPAHVVPPINHTPIKPHHPTGASFRPVVNYIPGSVATPRPMGPTGATIKSPEQSDNTLPHNVANHPRPYYQSGRPQNYPPQQGYYPYAPGFNHEQSNYQQYPHYPNTGYYPPQNMQFQPPVASKPVVIQPPVKKVLTIVNPKTNQAVQLPQTPSKQPASSPVPSQSSVGLDSSKLGTSPNTPTIFKGVTIATPSKPITITAPVKTPSKGVTIKHPDTGLVLNTPKKVVDVNQNDTESKIPTKVTLLKKEPIIEVVARTDLKKSPTKEVVEEKTVDEVEEITKVDEDKIDVPNTETVTEEAKAEDDGLEDGEIVEEVPEIPILPKDAISLESFEDIPYPNTDKFKVKPEIVNGLIKYDINFMKGIGMVMNESKGQLYNMPKPVAIYGEEKQSNGNYHRGGANNRGGVGMSRQASGQGSKRGNNKRNGLEMSRQNSSRGGHMPGRNRRGHDHRRAEPVVAPLVKSENAWQGKPFNLSESEKTVRTVKGILNKLTLDTFEKLLKKILEAEIDGQETLEAVIGLIFEKAIDESAFASMYAKLCLRLMKEFPLTQPWISPTGTQQDNAFRTLLLRRCQMEFEQDAKWTADDANSQSERAEIRKNIDSLTAEEKLKIAEEDYERGKLKRRVLGNIRFVGELFVQGLISETIIHRCIRSLLNNIKNPEEEDIESLIGLMIATGHKIDVSKSVDIMNSYFERIKELSVHSGLSNRIKFSLMDLMDLRKAKWASKTTGLLSTAEVRKNIEKEKRKAEEERSRQNSRSNSGYRGDRGLPTRQQQQSARRNDRNDNRKVEDGWTSVLSRPGATDKFGQISTPQNSQNAKSTKTVGAASKKKTAKDDNSNNQASKLSNSFDALNGGDSPSDAVETVTDDRTPQKIMEDAFNNYKDSYETSELLEDLSNVSEQSVIEELVTKIIQFNLDMNAKMALKITSTVVSLFFKESARFEQDYFWNGFKAFLVTFEEDRYDFPKAFSNISQILVPLYNENYMTIPKLLEVIEPLFDYGGIKPVAPDFLADFLTCVGESADIFAFLIKEQLDIKKFFPAQKANEVEIEKWIKFKKMPIVKNMNAIVTKVFEYAGYEVTISESYRWFDSVVDAEILSREDFSVLLATSIIYFWTIDTIFKGSLDNATEHSRDDYIILKTDVLNMAPIFTILFDEYLKPIDLLLATQQFCFENKIPVELEDLFRLYNDCEIVNDTSVYIDFKRDHCNPEAAKLLNKWYKNLESIE